MRRACLGLSLLCLLLGAPASSPQPRVAQAEGLEEKQAAAAPLLLPGTYPLRRALAEEGGVPDFEPAVLAVSPSQPAAGGPVNLPPLVSRQPLFARLPLGAAGAGVLVALDETRGTGAGYDRLFFEAGLDGNLAAAPAVAGELKQSGAFQTVAFDCPALPALYGGTDNKEGEPAAPEGVRVLVRGYRLGEAPWRFTYVLGEHRTGSIATPGGPVRVTLADSAMRAAFDRPCVFRSAIPTGEGAGPQLWLTPHPAGAGGGALQMSLGEAQLVGTQLYRFEPSADGMALTVLPYPGPAATARITAANARREKLPVDELTLQGSAGRYELDLEATEQALPPGEYHTLAGIRQPDREGEWVFRFRSRAGLRLPPDRPTDVPVGGPLRVLIGGGKPTPAARRGEEIKIPLTFVTAAGHELIGLQRADGRDGSAHVVVRSPQGKIIARSGSGFA